MTLKDVQLPALVHCKETKTSWRDGDSRGIFPTSLSVDELGDSLELLLQACFVTSLMVEVSLGLIVHLRKCDIEMCSHTENVLFVR